MKFLDSLKRSMQRAYFVDFLKTDPNYQVGEVHRIISEELTRFERDLDKGLRPKLILTMPPRHGKSSLFAEKFPVWVVGRRPSREVISTSYSLKPAKERVSKARDITQEQATFRLDLRKDTHSKIDWRVHGGGGCYAVGVGGSTTGLGADVLEVDDPHKDWEDVATIEQRDKAWDWYQSVALTRLSPKGGILIDGTRWHQDDLIGRCIATGKYRLLEFPAIATKDEGWRKEGEALHPERWPLHLLREIEEDVGPIKWQTLYQCNPIPDGAIVWPKHCIRTYQSLPCSLGKMRIVASWDLSFGSVRGSRVSGTVWGMYLGQYYLLEEVCGHMSIGASIQEIERIGQKYHCLSLVEKAAGGYTAIEQCKTAIHPVLPHGSKIARAQAVQPLFEKGLVHIPESLVDYINEITTFPQGTYDDRVDTTSMALNYLSRAVQI